MAKKKSVTKKPAKKTTAKKTAPKKTTRAKAAPKAKAVSKGVRRPSTTPNMPNVAIAQIESKFQEIKAVLEEYAANLRALDRKRLNGVGMKKQGFIARAYEYAQENPEFFPHYLTMAKFTADRSYFNMLRISYGTAKQIVEFMWNMIMEASDMVYTDALEYYASVREASKRRIDPAETIYKDLETFFKKNKKMLDEEGNEILTEKRLMRDAKAIAAGKKDGKIVIENIKPRLTGGSHKVIDEEFKDSARFKETKEGDID